MQQSHTLTRTNNKLSRRMALHVTEHKEPVATKHNTQISTGIELLYASAGFTTMLAVNLSNTNRNNKQTHTRI